MRQARTHVVLAVYLREYSSSSAIPTVKIRIIFRKLTFTGANPAIYNLCYIDAVSSFFFVRRSRLSVRVALAFASFF